MGPEILWYASEVPTLAISTAYPCHLIGLRMISTYISTYSSSREALGLTV